MNYTKHTLTTEATRRQALLQAQADAIEAARRVPADVAQDLAQAGFFRMLVPKALGGEAVHPTVFVEVLETLAAGDAATAWCVMTGATTGLLAAYLPSQGAQELWGQQPDVIMAGIFAPMGKATPVDGGYRLTGRWPFASGCENSHWRMGGAMIMEDGKPRMLEDGSPAIHSMFFSADESEVIDTWDTSGLRGTGSHDLAVKDVFVPAHRTLCILTDPPTYPHHLTRFPVFGLLAAGVSAVGLGIGRAAIDQLKDIAINKRRPGSKKSLADQEHIQRGVAEAEAQLQAGRALLHTTLNDVWQASEGLQDHESIDVAQRAQVRMATTYAAQAATQAVDAMYQLGGGTSIYKKCPLQRHFRDIHTMTQHIMVTPQIYKTVGRVLLDLPVHAAQL